MKISKDSFMYYGVHVVPLDFGVESRDDFLIYTDRRVVHSDMVDKEFIEELDLEEILNHANDRVDNRPKVL